jgi:hypothetical protein
MFQINSGKTNSKKRSGSYKFKERRTGKMGNQYFYTYSKVVKPRD